MGFCYFLPFVTNIFQIFINTGSNSLNESNESNESGDEIMGNSVMTGQSSRVTGKQPVLPKHFYRSVNDFLVGIL